YDRLWANMDRFYSHWDASPVSAGDLQARYRPRIEAAGQACRGRPGPCLPYRDALRDMLAELQDGHTHLSSQPPLYQPPLRIEPVEGRAVITRIERADITGTLPLAPGLVIVAVEGVPVDEALRRVPAWAVAYTAPRTRLYYAYRHLLAG